MIAAIHQPQYLPWLGYFHKILSSDVFILLDNVQFKKNDWQNRNKIKTPQGGQWLTVPVLHDFGQKITEVRINNKMSWRSGHLKSLQMNYAKAPFFKEYVPHFEEILGKEWEFLSELNIAVIRKCVELLGIGTKIVLASDYQATEESTQRLADLCKALTSAFVYDGRYSRFRHRMHGGFEPATVSFTQRPLFGGVDQPVQFLHIDINATT